MIEVEGPDGSVAEFPDGTSPDIIKQAMQKRYSPPQEGVGGWRDSPVGGFVRGLRDLPDAGAQLLTRGLEAVAPAGSGMEEWARGERERVEAINKAAEQEYQQWRGGDPGFDVGRIAGNVAATAPVAAVMPGGAATSFMGRVGAGFGQGAAAGALQPVQDGDFWTEKAKQVATGAGLGAAGGAAIEGVSRAIAPKVDDAVQSLMQRGVTPTPGQVAGGTFQRVEEGLTSVPILGDAIKAGQRRAMEQFNVAALDDALSSIGKSLPKGMEAGREAVETTAKMLGQAYDDLLPRMTAAVDDTFRADLSNLTGLTKLLPPEKATQFANILDDAITPRVQDGVLSGTALKEVQTRLGAAARRFGASMDPDQKLMADGFNQARDALRGLVVRSNPQYAQPLQALDEAYAKFLRVQSAAASQGAKEGVFSPAQLSAAARRMDTSGGKSQFARGNALMQDLATDAQKVLGQTVPDSGTPFRLMNLAGLGTGFIDPTIPGAALAASTAYTPQMQRALAYLMAVRPEGAQAVAEGTRKLSPVVASYLAAQAAQ